MPRPSEISQAPFSIARPGPQGSICEPKTAPKSLRKKSKIEKENKNDARGGPKRPQEEPKRVKRAKPNRMTKTGTNQHDAKIVLDPPTGRLAQSAPPPGASWEPKAGPKSNPKRSKFEAKNQETKKAIQDDLGPVLARSWVDLGPILGSILAKKCWKT